MSNHDDGNNVLVRFHTAGHIGAKSRLIYLSPEDREGIWLPHSQIAHIDTDSGEVWIPLWLAEKMGVEYE